MHFMGASFFTGGLFTWALVCLGVPLFSSEVFLFSPLHFRGATFFIGGLFTWSFAF
jgi:hypothetical protein